MSIFRKTPTVRIAKPAPARRSGVLPTDVLGPLLRLVRAQLDEHSCASMTNIPVLRGGEYVANDLVAWLLRERYLAFDVIDGKVVTRRWPDPTAVDEEN
jgi:hypothetical protein